MIIVVSVASTVLWGVFARKRGFYNKLGVAKLTCFSGFGPNIKIFVIVFHQSAIMTESLHWNTNVMQNYTYTSFAGSYVNDF